MDKYFNHLLIQVCETQGSQPCTKVTNPIKVQLAQGDMKPTHEVELSGKLECDGVKFKENFIMCKLDGFETIK